MTFIDFLDDSWLERSRGWTRIWTQARKLSRDPILAPDQPWEGSACYLYGTVLRDDEIGHWKMWYQTFTPGLPLGQRTSVCLAYSDDGLIWTKPRLEVVPGERWRDSNVVLVSNGIGDLFSPSVLFDPTGRAAERYKMMYWDFGVTNRGGFAASSRDGIRWVKSSVEPVWESRRGNILENAMAVCLDPFEPGYFLFHQSVAGESYPRCIAMRTSRDFLSWSDRQLVLTPSRDLGAREFYGLCAFPWRGRLLGLLMVFDPVAQTIQPHLAWSRDGASWSWHRDEPFIGLGGRGEFDDHMILPASSLADHREETWIYYGGFDGRHDTLEKRGAIGVAAVSTDRFCGLRAAGRADLTTVVVRGGYEVLVDTDAEDGELQIAVLSPDGAVVPGYSASECATRPEPGGKRRCSWRGLDSLPRAPCRLQVTAEGATLFGIEIGRAY